MTNTTNKPINGLISKCKNALYFPCKVLMIGLFVYWLTGLFSPVARAFTMSNSNYILNMGNLNSGAGIQSSVSYKLGSTVGQTAPGLFTGTNFLVKSGFWYVSSAGGTPFSFTISSTSIDFGTLTPTNPVTRTSVLTVSSAGATGYTVTAIENHPLALPNNTTTIPDTTCDAGTCTQTTASPWTSTLTYGFGYRCDDIVGISCAPGFSINTYYKQFASASQSESPVPVMIGTNSLTSNQAQITYKVNISGAQAAGTYTNAITYVATPTF